MVDGLPAEGSFRSHQVPLASVRTRSRAPRAARGVDALLPPGGAVRRGRRAARGARRRWRRAGERRMGANPHANGGLLLRELELPDFRDYAVEVAGARRRPRARRRACSATFLRDVIAANPDNFRIIGPDETASNRLGAVFEATNRRWEAQTLADRRPPRARRPRDGGAQRAPLPGLARGLPADRPPRPVQLLRGLHPHHRLDVQPAREVAEGHARDPLAAADRLAQLPALLARLAPGPQRLLATRIRASSTTSSTRRPRSSASTCRRTPTACCRSPTTACARATTST